MNEENNGENGEILQDDNGLNGINKKETEIVGNTVNTSYENVGTTNNSDDNKKGICIASMICGIVALVLMCFNFSYIAAVAGIILGAIGLKSSEGRNMAIAGLVTSIISIVLGVLIGIFAGIIYGLSMM